MRNPFTGNYTDEEQVQMRAIHHLYIECLSVPGVPLEIDAKLRINDTFTKAQYTAAVQDFAVHT